MMTWLGPSSESEHEDMCKRRSDDKEACSWILLRSEYINWQESEVSSYLWLKGIRKLLIDDLGRILILCNI